MPRWARKQGVEVGIFCALHTCGRQLNQHPHIHLSVTRSWLDIKHGVWRDIFFKKHAVEEIWRGAVIRLLGLSYDLINPGSLSGLGHIRDKNSGSAICRPSTDAAGMCTSRRRPGGPGEASNTSTGI
uniref:transposase n=1 Tax=Enterobacter TaxID=547 RepID=UPI002A805813|nr:MULTISPECIES: transposase [Enterobacter]